MAYRRRNFADRKGSNVQNKRSATAGGAVGEGGRGNGDSPSRPFEGVRFKSRGGASHSSGYAELALVLSCVKRVAVPSSLP
jgi:hypothetical protein